MPCPIWNTEPAMIFPSSFGALEADSPRAGGHFMLATEMGIALETADRRIKARVSSWIVEEHLRGVPIPVVDRGVVELVVARKPLAFSARVERFFRYLAWSNFTVGDTFDFIETDGKVEQQLSAWTESANNQELYSFIDLLRGMDLLQKNGADYSLTPRGFGRLEELERGISDSKTAFIAMWFDPAMQDAVTRGLEPAVRRAGYEPILINRVEHNRNVTDEIIANIKGARFVVADFTCGTLANDTGEYALPRGGVYFEAGYAYGLGIEVIWTCRRDQIAHVHFDTRQFAHVLWDTPEELEHGLYNRIVHVVGFGSDAARTSSS